MVMDGWIVGWAQQIENFADKPHWKLRFTSKIIPGPARTRWIDDIESSIYINHVQVFEHIFLFHVKNCYSNAQKLLQPASFKLKQGKQTVYQEGKANSGCS